MGRVNVFPNIHTVIPNKVVFSLEARHKDTKVIEKVEEVIKSLTTKGSEGGCDIQAKKLWDRDTVWFDKSICNLLEQSSKSLGLPYKRMVSGAGHDAQFIASYIPTALVFVPSINGKSHCEEELTTWEDCEKGVNVILETVLAIQSF
jgi:N-carbamoyl-L-amino-acid hydrolase